MSARLRSRITAVLVAVGAVASIATSPKSIYGDATLPTIWLDAEHPTVTYRVRAEVRDSSEPPSPRLTVSLEQHQAGRAGTISVRIVGAAAGDLRGTAASPDNRMSLVGSIWSRCHAETRCIDEVLIE